MLSAEEVAPLSSMAMAIFFGSIIFATVTLTTQRVISGQAVFKVLSNPRSSALDIQSSDSVFALLYSFSIFGLILFYGYICEYHPPYPHAEKSYDIDEFFFCTGLLILVSLFTLRKHNDDKNDDEVLNRDQTEEWKGWMQFMFLLYHYFHAEGKVYNAIRIMITCYVWMTGFGNFSFFYLKADYSIIRVIQMLWRLNFLVIFLCLTQGTTYILYYICLLHTYFFVMVYTTMWIRNDVNYTKWGIRIKLAVLAVVIFLVWDVDTGAFQFLHWPFLGETPMLGASSGAMWEWYFRSSLDHWSTFLGMIFALNFPITSVFFRKLEAQGAVRCFIAKALVGSVLLTVSYMWVTGPFQLAKFDYVSC